MPKKKLTKEEKAALLEAKKQAKFLAELNAQKKQMQAELERELRAQSLKRKEMQEGLMKIVMALRMPDFIQEVNVAWNTFERVYDKKDCYIRHLMKLIERAHEQYGTTVANFTVLIDNMVEKLFADLDEMSRINRKEAEALLRQGEEIHAEIKRRDDGAEAHLQIMIHHSWRESDDYMWKTKGENMVKADDEREICVNIRDELRSILEKKYMTIWEDYKNTLKNYALNTSENQKKAKLLKKKDNVMADIIAAQAKKMITNQHKIKKLREELTQYETGEVQAKFREKMSRYSNSYWNIKNAMTDGQALDAENLGTLVDAANSSIEYLTEAKKKGEKILRTAAIYRKFETQKEKVLPFGTRRPSSPTKCKSNGRGSNINEDQLVCQELLNNVSVSRLWQRMSRVNMCLKALKKEKECLIKENDLIERALKAYEEESSSSYPMEACLCTVGPCGPGKLVAVDESNVVTRQNSDGK